MTVSYVAGAASGPRKSAVRRATLVAVLVATSACSLGPRYVRPDVPVPDAFREAGEWKPVEPADELPRGRWWEIFGDPQLNMLEERLSVSNQTLKAAEAQFAQARALVGTTRAGYFPQVGGGLPVTTTSQSENRPNPSMDARFTDYLLRADVSYEADVWGRVRATVSASRASAQAAAGDLGAVNLTLHAELAADYLLLRALDAERQMVESAVAGYQRALELTTNRYEGGLASALDVAQAETQLEGTRAQAIDLQIRRAQLEHAMAVLVGEPASSFSLVPAPLTVPVPAVPAVVPSSLLERRPDIAAAERRVVAANVQLGITKAAYYPLLNLGGALGFEASSPNTWLKAASGLWTFAPSLALSLFDGGRRRSASAQARAFYDRTVAVYRETTLNAFKEVEDNLAALRILEEESRIQQAAVAAAQRALTHATNRYTGGISTYLEVISAQSALLANQRVAVGVAARRLTASVLLVKALGGGWSY